MATYLEEELLVRALDDEETEGDDLDIPEGEFPEDDDLDDIDADDVE